MKAAFVADVNDNPLKNKRKGSDPPINPIVIRFTHCFFERFLSSLRFLKTTINDVSKKATAMFFAVAKTDEFDQKAIANLLKNIANPLIVAVKNAK